jgi:hypothetical protein
MLSRIAVGVALALAASASFAVGRLADIAVVNRTTGESLPVYVRDGEYWIAGTPGHRYAVSIRNAAAGRLLAVLSIDGVNAVSGQTAAWTQTGYVFPPWQAYDVAGWRKSDSRVAAFEFTALADSYAARTGRPQNVGVIGVALFRERAPVVVAPQVPWPEAQAPEPARQRAEARGDGVNAADAGDSRASRQSGAAAPSAAPAAGASEKAAADAPDGASVQPRTQESERALGRIGTGHGRSETSVVGRTEFERAQPAPDEVITLHYDRRERLIALGIIPAPVMPQPAPFPGSVAGFVPDPPSRWGR